MMNPLSRTVCIGAVMFGLMTWMSASTQPLVLKVNELPSDLQRVPSTSAMFVTVRVADVWASETMKPIRELIAKQPGNPLEAIDQLGVKIENIERATLVLPSINEGGVSPLILVAMKQPFDASKLLKTLGARSPAAYMQDQIREEQKRYPGLYKMEPKFIPPQPPGFKEFPKECGVVAEEEPEANRDAAYYYIADGAVFFPIDDKTFAILYAPSTMNREYGLIAQMLQNKKDGPLTNALTAASENHHIVVGMNPKLLLSNMPDDLPAIMAPVRSLLKAQNVTMTFDFAATTKMGIDMQHADPAAAKKAAQTIDALRVLLVQSIPGLRKEFLRDPSMKPFIKLSQEVEKGFDEATVDVKEDRVKIRMEMKLDTAVITAIQAMTIKVQESARSMKAQNNLKQIGLGLHTYHDANGTFPRSMRPNSKFPVSWRVEILPYIEQDNLYRMYKFDEPWDSDNNKKLIPLMPITYELPNFPTKEKGMTYFRAFQGEQVMFPFKGGRQIADIIDGTSNTVMVVEAAEAVEWTRPDDLVYDPKKPLAKLGGHNPKGIQSLFADGSVRLLPATLPEKTWRMLIEINDGNVIPSLDR